MTFYLLLRHCRELKYNLLPRQPPVHRRERVQLILQRCRILRVQESAQSQPRNSPIRHTYTFSNLDPSTATRVRFPIISVGKTRSSRIFSCTLVSVRLRGLFCLTLDLRVGLANTRRCPTNTTWRSENFFSSSRVSLVARSILHHVVITPVDSPLLHLVECLQLRYWDENHYSLLASPHINFTRSRDL